VLCVPDCATAGQPSLFAVLFAPDGRVGVVISTALLLCRPDEFAGSFPDHFQVPKLGIIWIIRINQIKVL
jgi:hypothetical protein